MKGVPEGASAIIPRLYCHNPAAEIDFCVNAFGAKELGRREGTDGAVQHAILSLNSQMLMIEAAATALTSKPPELDGSSPVVLYTYVEDVDKVVAQAVDLGAKVLFPLSNQFWGDRIAWLMDPAGHVWTVATRIEETTAQERDDRWSTIKSDMTEN
jgi:PhnB protein